MVQTKPSEKAKANGVQPPAPRRRKSSKENALTTKESQVPIATKPNPKSRKKSLIVADSQLTLVKNGEFGDFAIHMWHDEIKILYNGTLVLAGESKLFEEFLDHGEIPPELLPLFYGVNAKYINGHIITQIFDYRHLSESNPSDTNVGDAKRKCVALKPNQMSIQADLDLLNYLSNGKLSEEQALQVEAEILRLVEPTLDLSLSVSGNKVKNALQHIEKFNKPLPVKELKNSTELEDEARELEEIKNMLLTMDEKRMKKWDIERVKLNEFILSKQNKQKKLETEITVGLDTKNLKSVQEPHIIIPSNFQLIRTIRYERQFELETIHTLLNVYFRPDKSVVCLVREGDIMDTGVNGFTKTLNFLNLFIATSFIECFLAANNLNQKLTLDTKFVTNPIEMLNEPIFSASKKTVSSKPPGGPTSNVASFPRNKGVVRPFMPQPGNKLSNASIPLAMNHMAQLSASDGTPITHPGNLTTNQLQAYQESRFKQVLNESQQLIGDKATSEDKGSVDEANSESFTKSLSVAPSTNTQPGEADPSTQQQGTMHQAIPGQFMNPNQAVPMPPLQPGYGGFSGQTFQRPANPMLMQAQRDLAIRQVQLFSSLLQICTPQQKVALRNLHDKQNLSNQDQQIIQNMLNHQNLNQLHRSLLTYLVQQYSLHHRAGYSNDASVGQVRPQIPQQIRPESAGFEPNNTASHSAPLSGGTHNASGEMQNEMLTALLKQQQIAGNQQAMLNQQKFNVSIPQQRMLGVRPGFIPNGQNMPNAQVSNPLAMQQAIISGIQANANNANQNHQTFNLPMNDKLQQIKMQHYAQYIAQAHNRSTQMLKNATQQNQIPLAQNSVQQQDLIMPSQEVNNSDQNPGNAPLTPYLSQNPGSQQGAGSIGSINSVHQTPAAATPQLGFAPEDTHSQPNTNVNINVPQTPKVHSVNQSETLSGGLHTPNVSLSMTPQQVQSQQGYDSQNVVHNQEVVNQIRQKNLMHQVAMNQAQGSKQPRKKRTSLTVQQAQSKPQLNTEVPQTQPDITPKLGQGQLELISPSLQQGSDFDAEQANKRAKIRPQQQPISQLRTGLDNTNNLAAQSQTNLNVQNQALINSLNSTSLTPHHLNLLSRLQQQPNLTQQQQHIMNTLQQKLQIHTYQQNLFRASQQSLQNQQRQHQQQSQLQSGQTQTFANEQQSTPQRLANQPENSNSVTATPIQPRPQTPSLNQATFKQNVTGQDPQSAQVQLAQAQAAQLALMQQRQAQLNQAQLTQAQLNQVQQAQLSQQLFRRQQLANQYSQQFHPTQLGTLQRPNFNNPALQQQYFAMQQQGLQNAMAQNPNFQMQLMNMAQANMALQNGNRPNFPPNAQVGPPQGVRPSMGLPHNFQLPNNENNPRN